MRPSSLPNDILEKKSRFNTVTLMYNNRIISIAQHVHGKDDHGEPLTTMEIAVIPQGTDDDWFIVYYNESPNSLINALYDVMKHIDGDN
jgi:hypothetical protein